MFAIFASLLTSKADIIRTAHTRDAIGSTSTTTSTVIHSLPCRVRNLTNAERAMWGTVGSEETHRMYCNLADIKMGDIAQIDGSQYAITHIDDPDLQHDHLEINLKSLETGQ